jgi:hypothetical protein
MLLAIAGLPPGGKGAGGGDLDMINNIHDTIDNLNFAGGHNAPIFN